MRLTYFIILTLWVQAFLAVPIQTSNPGRFLQSTVPTNGPRCVKSFTQKPVSILVIGDPIPSDAQLPKQDIKDGQSIQFWLRIGPLNKPLTPIAAIRLSDSTNYTETLVMSLDRITATFNFSLYTTKAEDPIATSAVPTKYNPRKWLLIGIKKTSQNEIFPTVFGKILPGAENLLKLSDLNEVSTIEFAGGKMDPNFDKLSSALEAKFFGLTVSAKNTNDFYLNSPMVYLDFRKNDLWKFGMIKNQDNTNFSQDAHWVYITAKTNTLSKFSDSASFPDHPGMAYVSVQPKAPVDLDLLGPAKNNLYIYADLIMRNNSDFFALLDTQKSVQ
jgi:hypothetical protein